MIFIFDLGKVFVGYDDLRIESAIAALCSDPNAETRLPALLKEHHNRAMRGDITVQQLHAFFVDEIGMNSDFEQFLEARNSTFTLDMDMVALAERLSADGHDVYMLSNIDSIHWEHLKARFPELRFFRPERTFVSYELREVKPDVAIYLKVLNRLAIDGANCLFIDDKPENIAGAKSAGLDAVLFTNYADFIMELERRGMQSLT